MTLSAEIGGHTGAHTGARTGTHTGSQPGAAPWVLRGPDAEDLEAVSLFGFITDPLGPEPEVEEEPEGESEADLAYQRGFEAGVDHAEAGMLQSIESTLSAFEVERTHFDEIRAHMETEVYRHSVDLALELTALLIGREVEVAENPGRDGLIRCLRAGPPDGHLTVRMHPDDASGLRDAEELLRGRSYEIARDASVAKGDVSVEYANGAISSRLQAALARVAEVLKS